MAELPHYDEEPLEDTTVVVQKKSAAPAIAVHATSFRDFVLDANIMQAIMDAAFEHPSEVQQLAIPSATVGTDLLCQAKSGMGKTAVFVLSALQRLKDANEKNIDSPLCLVLGHTRELAFQIEREFRRFGKFLKHIRPAVFFGGMPITADHTKLATEKPNVIIGTPGRIKALIQDKTLKLDHLQIFVLDECDSLLKKDDMRADVQQIFMSAPTKKQVMMFTATLPQQIRELCKKFMHNPVEIYVDNETKLSLNGLQQYYVSVPENQKIRKLFDILDGVQFNQVIIFVSSVQRCMRLAEELRKENFPVSHFHGQLSQTERLERYSNFKDFKDRILVATELFGRGIDIVHVNVVINFDLPADTDAYLHRVGRAGRHDTKGLAITFVQPIQAEADLIDQIQRRFEVEVKELPAHVDTIDKSTYT